LAFQRVECENNPEKMDCYDVGTEIDKDTVEMARRHYPDGVKLLE